MLIYRVKLYDGEVTYAVSENGGALYRAAGDPLCGGIRAIAGAELTAAQISAVLPPVTPSNILCIGLNYREHGVECKTVPPGHPTLFIKATNALCGNGDVIRLPESAPDNVDYEGELAVVIGRRAFRVAAGDAMNFVAGYTCANDVSARDVQLRADLQWARGKSFDTFCPLGPALATDLDWRSLRIRCRVNGEIRQDGRAEDLIFGVESLIEFLSRDMTLESGTVILTGTPAGVGMGRNPPQYLRAGDFVEVEIPGIGVLGNRVEGPGVRGWGPGRSPEAAER